MKVKRAKHLTFADREFEDDADRVAVWRQNAKIMYETVVSKVLEWPSLTVQWFPDRAEPAGCPLATHRLLLGTQTSGDATNHLALARARLPSDSLEKHGASGLPMNENRDSNPKKSVTKEEGVKVSVDTYMRVNHAGEVNRARYAPWNPMLVASKTVSGEVAIFDLAKYPSKPPEDGTCRPALTLTGHAKEGFGLEWSPLVSSGLLASAADDGLVCIWDVKSEMNAENGGQGRPLLTLEHGEKPCGDISWHCKGNMLASVGDDACIKLWDIRECDSNSKTPSLSVPGCHNGEIMTCEFNLKADNVLATGGTDAMVHLWDLRRLSSSGDCLLLGLPGHSGDIRCLKWSPFNELVLASGSADKTVNIWDLEQAAGEVEAEDDQHSALMFSHSGHTAPVNDLGWCLTEPWMMASVDEENMLMLWQVADNIHSGDISEDEREGLDGEGLSEGEDDGRDVE